MCRCGVSDPYCYQTEWLTNYADEFPEMRYRASNRRASLCLQWCIALAIIARVYSLRRNCVNRDEPPPPAVKSETSTSLLNSIFGVLGTFKTQCYTRVSAPVRSKVSRFVWIPDYLRANGKLIFHFPEVSNNRFGNFRPSAARRRIKVDDRMTFFM